MIEFELTDGGVIFVEPLHISSFTGTQDPLMHIAGFERGFFVKGKTSDLLAKIDKAMQPKGPLAKVHDTGGVDEDAKGAWEAAGRPLQEYEPDEPNSPMAPIRDKDDFSRRMP